VWRKAVIKQGINPIARCSIKERYTANTVCNGSSEMVVAESVRAAKLRIQLKDTSLMNVRKYVLTSANKCSMLRFRKSQKNEIDRFWGQY
jgi:hypothetical protein